MWWQNPPWIRHRGSLVLGGSGAQGDFSRATELLSGVESLIKSTAHFGLAQPSCSADAEVHAAKRKWPLSAHLAVRNRAGLSLGPAPTGVQLM
jgi:hypothetical protein